MQCTGLYKLNRRVFIANRFSFVPKTVNRELTVQYIWLAQFVLVILKLQYILKLNCLSWKPIYKNEGMNEWMNEWMMGGWMDEWMNERIYSQSQKIWRKEIHTLIGNI